MLRSAPRNRKAPAYDCVAPYVVSLPEEAADPPLSISAIRHQCGDNSDGFQASQRTPCSAFSVSLLKFCGVWAFASSAKRAQGLKARTGPDGTLS
jgi:hypothetical protein